MKYFKNKIIIEHENSNYLIPKEYYEYYDNSSSDNDIRIEVWEISETELVAFKYSLKDMKELNIPYPIPIIRKAYFDELKVKPYRLVKYLENERL